jgi:hypothetical protein
MASDGDVGTLRKLCEASRKAKSGPTVLAAGERGDARRVPSPFKPKQPCRSPSDGSWLAFANLAPIMLPSPNVAFSHAEQQIRDTAKLHSAVDQ